MKLRRLVVASQNPDKIREVEQVLSDLDDPPEMVRGLAWPEVEETESTLAGNALLKARVVMEHTGLAAVADDTGLEVDALDGAPGVLTARYAGEGATYADNVAKLLEDLQGVTDRSARFRTAVALVEPDGREVVVEGVLEGAIATEPRGAGGFGYDPVFLLDDGRTLAEIPSAEKNTISHRARALHALVAALATGHPALRRAEAGDAAQVRALVARYGWAQRVPDDATMARLIDAATRCVVAEVDGHVVGFGRAITDDISNGYLSMVVVAEEHRRRGIGRQLVERLTGTNESITWVLRAGSGHAFWKALGFQPSQIAMEHVRRTMPGETHKDGSRP